MDENIILSLDTPPSSPKHRLSVNDLHIPDSSINLFHAILDLDSPEQLNLPQPPAHGFISPQKRQRTFTHTSTVRAKRNRVPRNPCEEEALDTFDDFIQIGPGNNLDSNDPETNIGPDLDINLPSETLPSETPGHTIELDTMQKSFDEYADAVSVQAIGFYRLTYDLFIVQGWDQRNYISTVCLF